MKDMKGERLVTPGELQWRYFFDPKDGAIYDRLTGRRVDKVYAAPGPCHAYARYRQVTVPLTTGGFVRIDAHRMVWAAAHGRWPDEGMDIDHLNADVHDNRPANLAEVTEAENTRRGRIKRFVYLLQTAP